jgi:hypothetical protein
MCFRARTCGPTNLIDNAGMMRTHRAATGSLCACLLLLGACATPGPSPLSYGVRQLPGSDRSAIFQASEDSLVALGYRIDHRDPAAGVLTTWPVAGKLRDEAARPRARLGTPGLLRRIAQVRIEEGAAGMTVFCKVAVQEQTTEAHRLRASDYRTSDSPGYTPIDRDAATTKQQNTVWQTIRRDKRAEREILTAIEERTGGDDTTPPSSDTP